MNAVPNNFMFKLATVVILKKFASERREVILLGKNYRFQLN